ncbi:MAG TPA: hypothetical protein VGJ00_00145 [Rhabdochlamydiaceae bacterium]|jgi:hypothetical protein
MASKIALTTPFSPSPSLPFSHTVKKNGDLLSQGLNASNRAFTEASKLSSSMLYDLVNNSSPLGNVTIMGSAVTSIPNIIIGPINLKADISNYQYNDSIGNAAGKVNNVLSGLSSSSQTGLGVARTLTITSAIPNEFIKSPILAGLSALSATALNAIFIPYMGSIAVNSAYQSYQAHAFYKEYEKSGKSLQYLKDYISSPAILIDGAAPLENGGSKPIITINDSARSDLHIQGLELCHEQMRSQPLESWNETLEKVLNTYFPSNPELLALKEKYFPPHTTYGLSVYGQIGLLFKAKNMQLVHESILAQALGRNCLDQIKSLFWVDIPPETVGSAREIIDGHYKKMQRHYKLNGILAALGFALDFVGISVAMAFGFGPAIMLGINAALVLCWLYVDETAVNIHKGPRGYWDGYLIALMISLILMSMAASVVTWVMLGGNPLLVGCYLGLGVLMILFYIKLYYMGKKREEDWLKERKEFEDHLLRHQKFPKSAI